MNKTDAEQKSPYPKNLFQPGQSGNPSGRPKRTEDETQALAEIRKLGTEAVSHMKQLLKNPRTPAAVKVKIIEMILDRIYGKAPASVNVSNDAGRMEASRAFILSLVQDHRSQQERMTLGAAENQSFIPRPGDPPTAVPADMSVPMMPECPAISNTSQFPGGSLNAAAQAACPYPDTTPPTPMEAEAARGEDAHE